MSSDVVAGNVGQILALPPLRRVLAGKFDGGARAALQRVLQSGQLNVGPNPTIHDALDALTNWLAAHHRNEHVYKNAIANKIVLGRHNIETATMLAEFPVAASIADCVVVNGFASAYEIKTELDSPARLHKQLADYRQAFSTTYVVTHQSLAGKYNALLKGTATGLLALTPRRQLSTIRPAEPDHSSLSITDMMKALRKPEYTRTLARLTGEVPDVPNTRYFTECLRRALTVDPLDYHREFEQRLRERKLAAGLDNSALGPVRQLAFRLAPTQRELFNLLEWLDSTVAPCTTPTCAGSSTNYSR